MKLYRHQSIFTNLKRVIPNIVESLTPDQRMALCMMHSYTIIDGWQIEEISDSGDVTMRKEDQLQPMTYQQLADFYHKWYML